MNKIQKYSSWSAIVLTALYVLAGGIAKLMGVAHAHQSFLTLGLPTWFGYFIGVCEIIGAIALFIRPLSALSSAGLAIIMCGAVYYHLNYTPITQATPAFILLFLCIYIFLIRRKSIFFMAKTKA